MASVGDYIFLAIVLAIIGGIVYAVKGASVRDSIEQQKQAMRAKGLTLDNNGLAVRTNKVGVSREEEINRTQASFAASGKMMAQHANAFSFGGPKSEEQIKQEQQANAAAVDKAASKKVKAAKKSK